MAIVRWHLHWASSKQRRGGRMPPESRPEAASCQHVGLSLKLILQE